MNKTLLKKIILWAARSLTFGAAVAIVTVVSLAHLTYAEHPIARHLGLSPYRPVSIDVDDLKGSFADVIGFVAKCEPQSGRVAGWPVVTGVLQRVDRESLDSISEAPASFFQGRPQPLVDCMVKLAVLGKIATRINHNEPMSVESRQRLMVLLEKADSLAIVTKEAVRLEQAWYWPKRPHRSLDIIFDEIVGRCHAAAGSLRNV